MTAPESCRVYWGSHGCMLERGHDGEHLCSCTFENGVMLPHMNDAPGFGNVGRAPYYGAETRFYGEDAPGGDPEADEGYLVSFEILTERRNPEARLSGITTDPA